MVAYQCSYHLQLSPFSNMLIQTMQKEGQYICLLEASFSLDTDGRFCVILLHAWLGAATVYI